LGGRFAAHGQEGDDNVMVLRTRVAIQQKKGNCCK